MIDRKTGFYISLSFLVGILLTLGFKDVYPDLERRYKQRRRRLSAAAKRKSLSAPVAQRVTLEDHTKDVGIVRPDVEIAEGIEGTIGNTPLFKIKSLSDATGCEILAKAEVCSPVLAARSWFRVYTEHVHSSSTAQAAAPKTASPSA
jgi:cysteine synthase A